MNQHSILPNSRSISSFNDAKSPKPYSPPSHFTSTMLKYSDLDKTELLHLDSATAHESSSLLTIDTTDFAGLSSSARRKDLARLGQATDATFAPALPISPSTALTNLSCEQGKINVGEINHRPENFSTWSSTSDEFSSSNQSGSSELHLPYLNRYHHHQQQHHQSQHQQQQHCPSAANPDTGQLLYPGACHNTDTTCLFKNGFGAPSPTVGDLGLTADPAHRLLAYASADSNDMLAAKPNPMAGGNSGLPYPPAESAFPPYPPGEPYGRYPACVQPQAPSRVPLMAGNPHAALLQPSGKADPRPDGPVPHRLSNPAHQHLPGLVHGVAYNGSNPARHGGPASLGHYPIHGGFGCGLDGARRKNATRESTTTLKVWLQEHIKNPYPTKGEKIMLAIITKMTLTQPGNPRPTHNYYIRLIHPIGKKTKVSTWFANARRRLKKENKMSWHPKTVSNSSHDNANSKDNTTRSDLDDADIQDSLGHDNRHPFKSTSASSEGYEPVDDNFGNGLDSDDELGIDDECDNESQDEYDPVNSSLDNNNVPQSTNLSTNPINRHAGYLDHRPVLTQQHSFCYSSDDKLTHPPTHRPVQFAPRFPPDSGHPTSLDGSYAANPKPANLHQSWFLPSHLYPASYSMPVGRASYVYNDAQLRPSSPLPTVEPGQAFCDAVAPIADSIAGSGACSAIRVADNFADKMLNKLNCEPDSNASHIGRLIQLSCNVDQS